MKNQTDFNCGVGMKPTQLIEEIDKLDLSEKLSLVENI